MKDKLFIVIIMSLSVVLTACARDEINVENKQENFINSASVNEQQQEKEVQDAQLLQNQEQVQDKQQDQQALANEENQQQDDSNIIGLIPEKEVEIEKIRQLPEGFIYLDEVIPYATYDIRYYSSNNFVGQTITGYNAPLAIGTVEMAEALKSVSEELYQLGYTIHIYDTYRPAKAVSYFKLWAHTDDMTMKEQFYPNEDKSQLFKRGYLASKSGHSRGSTVDLTLVDSLTGELVDMGSEYDLLDEISSFNTKNISLEQAENRNLLRNTMVKFGFKEYSKEWWHYVLKDEPYPNTYFDFDVE